LNSRIFYFGIIKCNYSTTAAWIGHDLAVPSSMTHNCLHQQQVMFSRTVPSSAWLTEESSIGQRTPLDITKTIRENSWIICSNCLLRHDCS
jgi:hypothetical protein